TGYRTAVSQDGTNISGFWLQYSQALGNKFSFTMHNTDATSSTATRAVSTTVATTGTWYHLVAVRDKLAGTMKLYVNGQLQATTAYAGAGQGGAVQLHLHLLPQRLPGADAGSGRGPARAP